MKTKRHFSDDLLTALQESRGLRIRAGTGRHRFIAIWFVLVKDRVFVRSWSVKPDGWYRAFLHTPRDHHVVVRADLEGGRSQVLAEGLFPRCSPDGEWVLFKSEDGLRKVPIKGGEPILLSNFPCALFDIAPNGQHIACLYHPGHTGLWKLAIISPSGGRPVKLLDLPDKVQLWPGIRWTPDGEAVGLVVSGRGGDGNVWTQPIAGGQARQVTHFTSGGVKTFGWSRDGRYLAFSRSAETVDLRLRPRVISLV